MKKKSTAYVAQAAVIAAVYAVLTYLLQPISFSGGQLRISEALTILPVLTPAAVPALTLGCFISNLSSPFGAVDVALGTAATLISAILTRYTGNIKIKGYPVVSAVFPVIFNSLAVGTSVAVMNSGGFTLGVFAMNALTTALGEAIVCFVMGLPLYKVLEKTNIFDMRNK